MKKEKVFSIVGIIILLLSMLAGCSNNQASSNSKGSGSGGEKTEIVFWQPDSATWQPIYKKLIAKFEVEHPNIKVKNVNIAGDAYGEKLNSAFAAGQGPDLWVNWYSNDEYDRGYIASVDKYLKKDHWDMNKYFQPITDVRLKGSDGKYYGLPRDISMTTVLYNKDLFDKYKVSYPKPNWTFKEFVETAKKLTDKSAGVYGTDIVNDDYKFITGSPLIWNWMDGKDLVSADGWNVKGYMDNPKLIGLYKEAQELVKAGAVAPSEVLNTMTGQGGIFASGKIGMVEGDLWGFNMVKQVGFNWGVVPFPGSDDGSQKYGRSEPVNFYMNSKSKHPDQTWEFMKFMSGEEVGKIMADDFTWAPAIVSVWKEAGLDKDEKLGVFFNEGIKPTFNPLYLRNNKWWEGQEAYANAFQKMMNPLKGKQPLDPEKAIKEAAPKVQKKLEELKSQQ
jgi:multiple sugar transport system substrate-binding protein